MVRRSRSRSRRGGLEGPAPAPAPNPPAAPANGNDAAAAWNALGLPQPDRKAPAYAKAAAMNVVFDPPPANYGVALRGGRRTRRRRRGGSRKVNRRHVLLEIGKHLTRSKAMFHATRKHYTHEVAEHTRKGLPDNDKIVHMKKWLAENGSRH